MSSERRKVSGHHISNLCSYSEDKKFIYPTRAFPHAKPIAMELTIQHYIRPAKTELAGMYGKVGENDTAEACHRPQVCRFCHKPQQRKREGVLTYMLPTQSRSKRGALTPGAPVLSNPTREIQSSRVASRERLHLV